MNESEKHIIDSFTGKYAFLSNYANCKVTIGGLCYPSAEAAFQAQKCPGRENEFVNLKPNGAKHLGRRVKLRDNWDEIKDQVMYDVVFKKFSQNKNLAAQLLKTGDAYLEEGNTWGDRYWGTVQGQGGNKLGQILMKVRERLRAREEK